MEKYWICFLLFSVTAVTAQHDDDSFAVWEDYPDLYDYGSLLGSKEKNLNNDDKLGLSIEDKKSKEEFEQIEDNRSAQNPDEINDASIEKSDEKQDKDAGIGKSDEKQPNSVKNSDKNTEGNDGKKVSQTDRDRDGVEAGDEENGLNKGDVKVKTEEKKADEGDSSVYMDEQLDLPDIKEEPKLDKDKENDSDVNNNEAKNTKIEDVLEETKQILKDTNDDFDENNESNEANDGDDDETNDKYAEEAAKDILGSSKGVSIEEDTVDKVYQDLNKDLDTLMKTWKKLNDENNDYIEPEINADDAIDPDQISAYEKKYGVPYGEKYVLSLREQNYDDANNDEKMSDEVDDDENDDDTEDAEKRQQQQNLELENTDNEDTKDDEVNNKTQNDDDDLFKDDPDADDATSEEFDSSEVNDNAEVVETKAKNEKLIKAGDDAFLDENDSEIDYGDKTENEHAVPKSMLRDGNDELRVEMKSKTTAYLQEKQSSSKDEIVKSTVTEAATTIDVSSLDARQYDQLMEEFVQAHADDLDVSTFDAGRNVAPIYFTLTQEPLIVTSPNYPRPYPTNNIVDWMFTGEGIGIELIITDFFVNGVSGDYLLIKPGGIDASGREGLVFSHMLNEQRRYRFLDVDKMFVRFEARPGLSFRPGFSFSVRMVSPLPDDSESIETLPEPEALLPVPVETFTVLIGGPTLPEFNATVEDFRLLIADMATLYINTNDIDPGLNTTRQITQITNVAVCNLNWPNADRCSEVSFGVPLVYGDEEKDQKPRLKERELRAMWYLYSSQDPFAARLRNMGMEEFTSPNDSGVLTVWLVIGFGLLISMAMLAFALWRFSCFENYARMPTYSDRDSVYSEKQGLDLYPTPHQTLPPLFSENEYKWDDAKFEDSTRVDMGGFTNKSYNRDELFDIDSDEEIPPNKRDRGFKPRGFEV